MKKLALLLPLLILAGCDESTFAGLIAEYGPTAVLAIIGGVGTLFGLAWKKQSWIRDMVVRVGVEVRAAVLEVEQVYIDEIKRAKEPDSDGGVEITKSEAVRARELAIAAVKRNIGIEGLRRLVRILGIGALDEWLGTHVEAAVKQLSLARPTTITAISGSSTGTGPGVVAPVVPLK